jgi:hypothetical protein
VAWSIAGVVLLFLACFLAWKGERDGRLVAENRLKDEFTFNAFMNWIAFGDPGDDGMRRVLMLVSVNNGGARASIVHHWRVYVSAEDGLEKQMAVIHPLRDERVSLRARVGHVEMDGNDFISYKTFPSPIIDGGGARGFLMFGVPNTYDIRRLRIRMTYHDVVMQRYECESSDKTVIFNDTGEYKHWPGVTVRSGRIEPTG